MAPRRVENATLAVRQDHQLRLVSPAAAAWSVPAAVLLWGPWPGPVMPWVAWGWPGTTSPADAQNFFYPQHAALTALLALLLVALGGALDARRLAALVALAALVITTHPYTGLALAPALTCLTAALALRGEHPRAALLGLLLVPAAASAQSATYEQRGYVEVNLGAQSGSHLITTSSTFTIYDEPGSIDASQSYGGGVVWGLGGGARVWRNLVLGLAYTRHSDEVETAAIARVPHPLFLNRYREANQRIDDLKGSIIEIPELDATAMHRIDAIGASFWAASHAGEGAMTLRPLERQRVKLWLKQAYAALDAVLLPRAWGHRSATNSEATVHSEP